MAFSLGDEHNFICRKGLRLVAQLVENFIASVSAVVFSDVRRDGLHETIGAGLDVGTSHQNAVAEGRIVTSDLLRYSRRTENYE